MPARGLHIHHGKLFEATIELQSLIIVMKGGEGAEQGISGTMRRAAPNSPLYIN